VVVITMAVGGTRSQREQHRQCNGRSKKTPAHGLISPRRIDGRS